MKAEIVTIGDELLIGQVIDTNSAWIAEQLNLIGISVVQITSIPDSHSHILTTLAEAAKRADVIIMTGGLGPTKDDVTKLALCDYFKAHLVFDQPSYDNIERLFKNRGFVMTDVNRKQAEVLSCCDTLLNENGTAPGMWIRQDGKIYVSMPGVPFEMKSLMLNHVLPRLKPLSKTTIIHRTILTHGVGESFLASKIENWESSLPSHIKLAYLPQIGMVRLRLSASGTSRDILSHELDELIVELYQLIPEHIFGEAEDNLETVVAKYLKEQNLTLATAESCTGGYLAHLITSVAGSSAYFNGSVISYSNEVKTNVLGVKPKTIETHGAVSRETVIEMAEGLKKVIKSDFTISISGIAGPDGGTDDKPVGTVWIAISTPYKGTLARKFQFGKIREHNIRRSALAALDMLRNELQLPLVD
jgi:nicotinamide-nucleotide amidase